MKKTHRAVLARLRGGELSPGRLGGSVALGLFIGILPLYGLHLPLCAFFALALRLDVFVTYLAANISIPPMIPVLLFAGLQLGSLLMTGSWHALGWEELRANSLLATGAQLFLGSTVLALLAALVGGTLSYALARRFRRKRPSVVDASLGLAIERAQAHYGAAPRQHRYYVASKLRLDPLTRELFDAAADGTIRGRLLDVGAGRGQFSAFLAELGAVDSIVGFDHDAAKIDVAAGSAITWPVPAEFNVGDLRAQPMPLSDTILLLDVLHYLNTLEQDAVLGRAVSALRPGGHLFLRETNRGSGAGSFLAGQLERLARFLGVNRGERLMFRAPDEYVGTLTQLGLEVRTLGGRGALDNVLLIASHTDSSR